MKSWCTVLSIIALLGLSATTVHADTHIDCPAGQMQRQGGWRTCIPMQGYRDIGKQRVAGMAVDTASWVAIATSVDGLYGFAFKESTKDAAVAKARSMCESVPGTHCTVPLASTDECAGLALSEGGRKTLSFTASGKTKIDVEEHLQAACAASGASGCQTKLSACSKDL